MIILKVYLIMVSIAVLIGAAVSDEKNTVVIIGSVFLPMLAYILLT